MSDLSNSTRVKNWMSALWWMFDIRDWKSRTVPMFGFLTGDQLVYQPAHDPESKSQITCVDLLQIHRCKST